MSNSNHLWNAVFCIKNWYQMYKLWFLCLSSQSFLKNDKKKVFFQFESTKVPGVWCVFCKWRKVTGPCKAKPRFRWQTFACWIGEWRGECDILRRMNYFICVNYLFNRNESNFPGSVTSILRGSFTSSWWGFWCFINSSLLVFSRKEI